MRWRLPPKRHGRATANTAGFSLRGTPRRPGPGQVGVATPRPLSLGAIVAQVVAVSARARPPGAEAAWPETVLAAMPRAVETVASSGAVAPRTPVARCPPTGDAGATRLAATPRRRRRCWPG